MYNPCNVGSRPADRMIFFFFFFFFVLIFFLNIFFYLSLLLQCEFNLTVSTQILLLRYPI